MYSVPDSIPVAIEARCKRRLLFTTQICMYDHRPFSRSKITSFDTLRIKKSNEFLAWGRHYVDLKRYGVLS